MAVDERIMRSYQQPKTTAHRTVGERERERERTDIGGVKRTLIWRLQVARGRVGQTPWQGRTPELSVMRRQASGSKTRPVGFFLCQV